jgi:hypothetical protein
MVLEYVSVSVQATKYGGQLDLGLVKGLNPRAPSQFIWPFYKIKSKMNKISIRSDPQHS